MSQHTGSHKNNLNFLGEKYLNESHWPMRRIKLVECMLCDVDLAHISLTSHFWDIGKQCRPRSDAQNAASDQGPHCLLTGIYFRNRIK